MAQLARYAGTSTKRFAQERRFSREVALGFFVIKSGELENYQTPGDQPGNRYKGPEISLATLAI
jgi:hypothetical protein